jgi:uncharacterized protein (DUF2235 family)
LAGLVREGNEDLIPYAIDAIRSTNLTEHTFKRFQPKYRECKPHFVGVWDTVSSQGWIYNVVFPLTTATRNPDLHIVRQAVSIDERRAFFRQNLFGPPSEANPTQTVEEVWFAGVHSDVSGSYPEPESQLSKITLQWLLCEGELAGLRVDSQRKAEILGAKPPYVKPDASTKNIHKSLHGHWWLAELWPKVARIKNSRGAFKKVIRLNLGRPRWIPPDSSIHKSVVDRMSLTSLRYSPRNLPTQYRIVEDRCVNGAATAVTSRSEDPAR